MSYAVKYKTNKGEEEMKKRRVAKLIALSMVAATLLTGVNVQAKEEKVVTAMTSIDLTPELCDPIKSGIINEVRGVNRVFYDLTSKPPGTIEFE